LHFIQRHARLAEEALAIFPDLDPAWGALADFYDEFPVLMAALETIAFDKTPQWLEFPAKRDRLFKAFVEVRDRQESHAA